MTDSNSLYLTPLSFQLGVLVACSGSERQFQIRNSKIYYLIVCSTWYDLTIGMSLDIIFLLDIALEAYINFPRFGVKGIYPVYISLPITTGYDRKWLGTKRARRVELPVLYVLDLGRSIQAKLQLAEIIKGISPGPFWEFPPMLPCTVIFCQIQTGPH